MLMFCLSKRGLAGSAVLIQEGLLGLSLRVSDSVGLQQALRLPISNSFQVVLMQQNH